MPSGPGEPVESDWAAAVTVREDPGLGVELGLRWAAASGQRAIGVTDLMTLRPAFWRRTAPPVPEMPGRARRLAAGRRVHRLLADLLAPEGSLEVRIRRAGLAGRIDVLTDRPVEIKSASGVPGPSDLLDERPEYVEQLAMYCALTDRPTGRLLTVVPRGGDTLEVRTLDLRFGDLGVISTEMERRAELLRAALVSGSPAELPRCRWFERGCEYRAGPTCDCQGSEVAPDSPILAAVEEVRAEPEVDAALGTRLSEAIRAHPPPVVGSFRDLVYPRRTYFERTEEAPVAGPEGPSRPVGPTDVYARLTEALESGPVGEVARLPSLADEPEEEVAAFRGVPYLARTSRAWEAVPADQLVARVPQYALELGFRCAATGTRSGRAIVAYDRAVVPAERVKVYELRFDPVSRFARLWRQRQAAVERAVAERSPSSLPACPPWMFATCPYRAACGCAEPGRSQR